MINKLTNPIFTIPLICTWLAITATASDRFFSAALTMTALLTFSVAALFISQRKTKLTAKALNNKGQDNE